MPVSKTRLNLAAVVPDGPSVQAPIVPMPYQPIPQVRQQQLPVDTLGAALSGFGNKIAASMNDLAADDIAEARLQSKRSNEDYTAQAVADAQAGREPSEALNEFDAYSRTYSKVKGHNEGAASFETFLRDVGSKMAPGDDPEKALQEWRKANPSETGNPLFDGSAAAQFAARAQSWRTEFGRNAVQASINDGVQNWQTNLALTVQDGSLTPERIQSALTDYGRLDPMNAHKAGAAVVQSLVGQARTPEEARLVLNTLSAPGSAGPDKSFATRFPDAFAAIDAQLAKRHGEVLTLAAAQGYSRVQERVLDLRNSANPMTDGVDMINELNRINTSFGGKDAAIKIRGQIEHILDGAKNTIATVNQIEAGRTNPMDRDVGLFTKKFDDFLKFHKINPLSGDPSASGLPQNIAAGSYVGSYNAIDANTKANVSNAIMDPTNPAVQQRAIDFYKSAEGHVGRERVLALMSDDAARIYQAVADEPDMTQALQRISQTPKGDAPPLTAITGKASHADAEAHLRARTTAAVNDYVGVNGYFSAGASVSPGVNSALENIIKIDAADAARRGAPMDLDKIAARAVQRHAQNFQVIPGEDGRRVITWSPNQPKMVPDPNAPGKMLPVVAAGRNVLNPATGKPEDTTATAETDMQALAARLPGRIGDREGLSLSALPGSHTGVRFQTQGVLTVTHKGDMVVFKPGETIEVAERRAVSVSVLTPGVVVSLTPRTTKIKVEGDGKALAEAFNKQWPDSPFTLIPMETPQGRGFALAYRYRFANSPPTAAEREQSYKPGQAVEDNNASVGARQNMDTGPATATRPLRRPLPTPPEQP